MLCEAREDYLFIILKIMSCSENINICKNIWLKFLISMIKYSFENSSKKKKNRNLFFTSKMYTDTKVNENTPTAYKNSYVIYFTRSKK